MGGCGSKQQCYPSLRETPVQADQPQARHAVEGQTNFSISLIKGLNLPQEPTQSILTNDCLLSIPQSLLQEAQDFFDFSRIVEGCTVYRKANDSPFAAAYATLEGQKFNGLNLWRSAVKDNPTITPGCSEKLMDVLLGLPERCWSLVRYIELKIFYL